MTPALLVPRRAVHNVEQLQQLWVALTGPWEVRKSRLRFLLFDADHRPLERLVEIEVGVPDVAWLAILANIADMVEEFAAGGSVAVMIQRPGPPRAMPEDRAWLRMLADTLSPALYRWPVAVGTDAGVRMVAPRVSGAGSA